MPRPGDSLPGERKLEIIMAEITASLVKQLRERTGAGMMECKSALVEAKGDLTEGEVSSVPTFTTAVSSASWWKSIARAIS